MGRARFRRAAQGTRAQAPGKELMYLLDTNTCVYVIRKRPEAVFQRLSRTAGEEVALSAVTAFEDSAREVYGRLRTGLERRGERIGAHDMLIAAHAIVLGATLVTNNEREFKRVKGLRIENWVA